MKINYNNKKFRTVHNSSNGETSPNTIFLYKQSGHIVTATYSGGEIAFGHLLGSVDDHGNIDMRYHQINASGIIMTGKCLSKPEILTNGKIRLHEIWEWTSGDFSKGESVIDEI